MTSKQITPPTAPNLPLAPQSYAPRYFDQLTNVLRLYFVQLDARFQQLLIGFNHYGVFSSSSSQTAVSPATAYAVAVPTTVEAADIAVAGNSMVLAARSGVYRAVYTMQVHNAAGTAATAWFWFAVDSAAVAASPVVVPLAAGATQSVVVEFLGKLTAGSDLQCMWATDDTDVSLLATAAAAPVPAIPSARASVSFVYPAGV